MRNRKIYKRGLNKKEKATLKIQKNLVYTPEIVECKIVACRSMDGTYTYHAVLVEREYQVSLSKPGDLSDLPPAKNKK